MNRRSPLCRPRLLAVAGFFAFGLTAAVPRAAMAQDMSIAAVVNDDVITILDLEERLKFIEATGNIPASDEAERRIAPQVLRQLIDEKLEMQEAKKEGIEIDQDEINAQLAALEAGNHMPPGGLDKFFEERGIDKQTLVDQLTAQMAWRETVSRRWRPFVSVGEEELADAIKDIEAHRNQPESRIAEIYLSVPTPSDDAQVKEAADRIVQDIRAGANFSALAQRFSAAPTAAGGGDLGWVQPATLPADEAAIISKMQPGTLGGPFRLTGGYYIFELIDRRTGGGKNDVQLKLSQMVLPLADGADAATHDAVVAKARAATADARSCGELEKIGKQLSPQLSGPLGVMRVADLPPELRPILDKAKVAVPTDPVPTRGGIGVFMICGRDDGEGAIKRDEVENSILNQRLEARAQQYLSDLRRVAYIDLRV